MKKVNVGNKIEQICDKAAELNSVKRSHDYLPGVLIYKIEDYWNAALADVNATERDFHDGLSYNQCLIEGGILSVINGLLEKINEQLEYELKINCQNKKEQCVDKIIEIEGEKYKLVKVKS